MGAPQLLFFELSFEVVPGEDDGEGQLLKLGPGGEAEHETVALVGEASGDVSSTSTG